MFEMLTENPATVVILLGLIIVLAAFLLPTSIGIQILVGGLGVFMLIIGIIVHAVWLQTCNNA